uniref:Type II toxin-antitoxin system PemK/MazF family toxin n=1 Tax=Steinernema glaseri TaxID=37863 RepID=A0A1I7ZAA6_9BILA
MGILLIALFPEGGIFRDYTGLPGLGVKRPALIVCVQNGTSDTIPRSKPELRIDVGAVDNNTRLLGSEPKRRKRLRTYGIKFLAINSAINEITL